MTSDQLLRDFLLRATLRRYAHPVKAGKPRPAIEWAEIAYRAESSADLLRNACDAWDISLGELALAAGLDQTVLAQFVMGTRQLSWEEHKAVVNEMHAIVNRKAESCG